MILKAENLSFSYGDHQVLSGFSFGVEKGAIYCIMGPNGCGKTTLLDCLMGINAPAGGKIELLGRELGEYSRKDIARHISYMPQIHGISFPYTVRDFVLMGRMAYTGTFGSPGKEDYDACSLAMKKAGVLAYADKAYSSLSGGELRLALLARALCQQAEIIMMDEPTAHLDFRNEMLFIDRIAELAGSGEASVVMSTHSPNHALMLESKGLMVEAILMKDGKVFISGKPSEVINSGSVSMVFGVESEIIDLGGLKNMVIKGAVQ